MLRPISPNALANTRSVQTVNTLHNLTAYLLGIGAGTLGLESYYGFLFYFLFSVLTSLLFYAIRIRPTSPSGSGLQRYFRSATEFWTGGLTDGLSGFVLTWTLFYGLVRV